MNHTQISEDRHPSRDREIAEQIESTLSNHPGIPRESLYMRLRGRTNDAELAAARRQVLVEALKDLLRSGTVIEARVGTQALLYLKGEQPQGAAVYSLHQPAMKVWVDPNLKGSYEPTERVVDERTIVAIPKERDDRPVRTVAKVSAPAPIVVAKAEQIVPEPEASEPEPETIVAESEPIPEPISAESEQIAVEPEKLPAAPVKKPRRRGKFAAGRRTISANMSAEEAKPIFDLAAQRGTTASQMLCGLLRDFMAKETGAVRQIDASGDGGESLETLVADVYRANRRLFNYVAGLPKE